MRLVGWAAVIGLSLAGCGSGGDRIVLLVELSTDYAPGLEFESIEIAAIPAGGTIELISSRDVDGTDDFVSPSRVAEYPDFPAGRATVRVRLRSATLRTVAERQVEIEVTESRGVTVVITRDCAALECPAPGDDPASTECFAGRCVPRECPGDPTACGTAECATDGECVAGSECTSAVCRSGACLVQRHDSECGPMEVCHPDRGCVPSSPPDAAIPPPMDAGIGTDAGPPIRDAGAIDAPSDAGVDAPPDAGCTDPTWGVANDDTSDVAGDSFGRQTWTPYVCGVPAIGQRVPLHVRARITAIGTELDWDIFGTGIWINGVGGYRDDLMTWSYVTVSGSAFTDYTIYLPADIDGNGAVDWTLGSNTLEITTWSDYNDRPGRTGVDSLVLGLPGP